MGYKRRHEKQKPKKNLELVKTIAQIIADFHDCQDLTRHLQGLMPHEEETIPLVSAIH